MGLPHPFEVLDVFGRKFKFKAPNAFKFSTKWVPIEVNNWWKFGVDISNHFWEIQILRFFVFQVSPTAYKNNFQKLFLYVVGDTWTTKNLKIWISQKWFEISTPNFHQLSTSIGTRFVLNLKAPCALDLDFLPKTSKISNNLTGLFFSPNPSNLVRIHFSLCYENVLE